MHAIVIVVGDVEKEMDKFNEELTVEPWYNEPLHEDERKRFTDWVIDKDPTALSKLFEELVDEYSKEWSGGDEWKKNEYGNWQVWSTYNSQGVWDWYTEGGRWSKNLTNKSGGKCSTIDKAQFKEFEYAHAFLKNGEWTEEDAFSDREEFYAYVKKEISELNDEEWITSVDYHC